MISVLFVCFGNVCRSPALQGFLEKHIRDHGKENEFHVESCAVGAHFVGQNVDPRMKAFAKKRGVELDHKAIIFDEAFFNAYDYIFVVTDEILQYVKESAPNKAAADKVMLATCFSKQYKDKDIPDPYYGGEGGFDYVFDIIEESAEAIYQHLTK